MLFIAHVVPVAAGQFHQGGASAKFEPEHHEWPGP